MDDLAGKRIIIAGGATGIGAGLAVRLVDLGAKVIVGDRNADGLDRLMPDLQGKAGVAVPFVFDLMEDASIKALVDKGVAAFGGIDGVAIPAADTSMETMGRDNNVMSMESDVWMRTYRINVVGHGMLIKYAVPHLIENGGGAIVVVSSEASFRGVDYVPAYAASKAGLGALVRHSARLLGKHKIRVNGITPGRIINDRSIAPISRQEVVDKPPVNALLRHGSPRDTAGILAFLLSEESGWITGQVIACNGGSDMRE